MNKVTATILVITFINILNAQNVGINTDGSAPDASAMLEIKSINSGLLIPRVNITDLSTAVPVTNPAKSLLVYNTNTTTGAGYYYWNGNSWIELLASNRAWKFDGNTISSSDFLGTNNAEDLVLKTNGSEKVRVKTDGKVGIGTINPDARLQVTGDNNTYLNVGTDDTYQGTISLFGNPTGYPGGEIDIYTGNDYDTDIPFYFIDAYQDWLRICRAGVTYDFGLYKNGHIRIGQARTSGTLTSGTDPVKMLQVNDVANGGIGLDYQNGIWFKNQANDGWIRALTVHDPGNINSDIYIGSGANPPETNIHLDVGGTGITALFVDGVTGKVGIGHGFTSPTTALEVKGVIKTTDNEGSKLWLGSVDNTNEGGEITFAGAGSYPNWTTDIYQSIFRIFSNTSSTTRVKIFNDDASNVTDLEIDGEAYKPGGGSWITTSDIRSKENIKDYTKGLAEILKLHPVNFNYKKEFGWGNKTYTGLIAQEVEKVVPTMVHTNNAYGFKDFKSVDPNELIYMLINAIKEQEAKIERLEKIIKSK